MFAIRKHGRAAALAASLGRKNERYKQVISVIEAYLTELDATDPLITSCHLMDILLEQKEGDRARYAALAEKAAHAAKARGNYQVAQSYLSASHAEIRDITAATTRSHRELPNAKIDSRVTPARL